MGMRSGLPAGHSGPLTPTLANHFFMDLAFCTEASHNETDLGFFVPVKVICFQLLLGKGPSRGVNDSNQQDKFPSKETDMFPRAHT